MTECNKRHGVDSHRQRIPEKRDPEKRKIDIVGKLSSYNMEPWPDKLEVSRKYIYGGD